MKKGIKILLVGAGVAVAGFLAYSVLKKPKEPAQEEVPPVSTSTKEYVEHRKALMREKVAEKARDQEETSAPVQEVSAPAAKTVESSVAAEVSEELT